MRSQRLCGALFAVYAGVLLARASSAWAHDPPHGLGLVWSSAEPDALPLVVSNRGLVFADPRDSTPRFSLRCNEGYGAASSDVPSAFFTPRGGLALSVYSGVSETSDRGCSWTKASGLMGDSFGSAVQLVGAPDRLLVAARSFEQEANLFLSEDGGKSWSLYARNPLGQYYDALLVAPSDGMRLYAAGRRLDRDQRRVISLSSVSRDAGRSWEDRALPSKIIPFAVHPQSSDVVFAYEATNALETVFRVLRSDDAGASFRAVLEGVAMPSALVAGSEPSTLFLGVSGQGGLYRSTDEGLHFDRVASETVLSVTCLRQRGARLWLCATTAPNVQGIWFSDDQARSLQRWMTFADVTEPVTCEGDAQLACARSWYDFDIEQHPPALATPDAAVADAGPPDGDASDNEPVAADTGALPDDPLDAGRATMAKRSRGCQLATAPCGAEPPWWVLALAALSTMLIPRPVRRAGADR